MTVTYQCRAETNRDVYNKRGLSRRVQLTRLQNSFMGWAYLSLLVR